MTEMRKPRLKIPNTPPREGCLPCTINSLRTSSIRRSSIFFCLQSFDNRRHQRPFFHLQPYLIRDERNLIVDVVEIGDEERRFIRILRRPIGHVPTMTNSRRFC